MQENASLRTQVSQAEADREDAGKQLVQLQSHVNEVTASFLLLLRKSLERFCSEIIK